MRIMFAPLTTRSKVKPIGLCSGRSMFVLYLAERVSLVSTENPNDLGRKRARCLFSYCCRYRAPLTTSSCPRKSEQVALCHRLQLVRVRARLCEVHAELVWQASG